jgi:hypothetical protein
MNPQLPPLRKKSLHCEAQRPLSWYRPALLANEIIPVPWSGIWRVVDERRWRKIADWATPTPPAPICRADQSYRCGWLIEDLHALA